MIVYVESNFVLELALQQEQSDAAEEVLRLREDGKLEVVLPAFALLEPYWTIKHRGEGRRELCAQLWAELGQLGRSAPHKQLASTSHEIYQAMLAIEATEGRSFDSVIHRLLQSSRLVAVDTAIVANALRYMDSFGLSLVDATIYSSVVADLARSGDTLPKCLASRDSKAFFDPEIKEELGRFNCRYIANFPDALAFIRSEL
jgi:hypothetical protein